MFVIAWRKTGGYGVCLKLGGSSRKPAVIMESLKLWVYYCRNCAFYTDLGLHRLPLPSLHFSPFYPFW